MAGEAEKIVQHWLDELSFSAATWDLDAHMKLVSPQVKVTGIPGVDSIGFKGWKLRRKNEFDNKMLRSLTYRMGDIVSEDDEAIRFRVEETMKASSGKVIVVDKEVTLQREDDGHWRVRREHFERIRQG